MGAAYLCAEAGISNVVLENQAAYVAGWLKKLGDDRKLLIHAATQAQRAADYILKRICHDEARAMLGEIYGWFTEGFDTPVLKNAKGAARPTKRIANPACLG
jgi:hypothetical protein